MHPTLWNAPKLEFRVQWGGLDAFVAKNSVATLWHKLVHYLHQFNPFCTKFRVVSKHLQGHPNTTKRTKTWVQGPMGWIGCVCCEKFQCDYMAQTCAFIAQVQPILHRVSCSIETLPNAPKCYATQQNKSLGSTWLDWVCSLRKISRRLHGTYLCVICTSSTYFALSFV